MRTKPSQPYIALYGSLRRGQQPHAKFGLNRHLELVGPCLLQGVLHDFGDWPGLVEGDGQVVAELYAMRRHDILEQLDTFEACDPVNPEKGLFVRRLVRLIEPAGISAYVYYYNHGTDGQPVITSGDWVRHLGGKAKL